MSGIILAGLLLAFGIFLKATKDAGFTSAKKFSWLLIALGAITLAGKLIIMYQKGEI